MIQLNQMLIHMMPRTDRAANPDVKSPDIQLMPSICGEYWI